VRRKIIATAAVLGATAATGWGAATSWAGEDEPATVPGAFASAAEEFKVPEPLLKAYSYSLTGLRDHGSEPSASGGYGLMHLTMAEAVAPAGRDGEVPRREEGLRADPAYNTLNRAASLLGEDPSALREKPAENIRGGAALLADEARKLGVTSSSVADWYPVVSALNGSVATDVFRTLRSGAGSGELAIAPAAGLTVPSVKSAEGEAECPASLGCTWLPAAYQSNDDTDANAYGNYDTADRPSDIAVKYIVIHDTESSYESTLNYFQDPLAYTSSHYVIRSSDGAITQMVKTKDIAWHAGNSLVNAESIGIEHEAVAAEGATWYTDEMYRSSAELVRFLAAKYDIPLDREHILGHNDIANQKNFPNSHWDPGPFWDWDRYMELLKAPTSYPAGDDLVTIAPDFATNKPQLTYCTDGCQTLPLQPANTVLLRTGPGDDQPFIKDPVIGGGTDDAADWSDKVVSGRRYAVAERSGDWTAIWFGGQKAWLPTAVLKPATGKLVRPHDGATIFPANLPEASDWPEGAPAGSPATPPTPAAVYTIAGTDQSYELADESPATLYYARFDGAEVPHNHTVIKGETTYYRISFNHRYMYVRSTDADLL
jgi:N-acetyl-anhydromuramyl-L-alanine amidase AmpD